MAKRITVTAIKPLHYEGRSHVRGSVFTATPVDAASLKYRGLAKLGGQLAGGTVPEHPSITRRVEPVQMFATPQTQTTPDPPATQAPIESVDAPAEAPTTEPEEPRSPRGRRGRTYNRRDMQAESSTDAGE